MLAWSSEHPYRPKFLAHMLAWDPTLCLPKIQAYSQFRKPDPPSKPHQHDNLGLCPPLPHLGRYQAHAEITRFALSSWAQAPRSSHTPACAIPKASCKPTPQGLHEPAPTSRSQVVVQAPLSYMVTRILKVGSNVREMRCVSIQNKAHMLIGIQNANIPEFIPEKKNHLVNYLFPIEGGESWGLSFN